MGFGFWLSAGKRESVNKQKSRGSKNSEGLASCKERGQADATSPWVFLLASFLGLPCSTVCALLVFIRLGSLVTYEMGLEATESLDRSKLGSLQHPQSPGSSLWLKGGVGWCSWHERGPDTKEPAQHE